MSNDIHNAAEQVQVMLASLSHAIERETGLYPVSVIPTYQGACRSVHWQVIGYKDGRQYSGTGQSVEAAVEDMSCDVTPARERLMFQKPCPDCVAAEAEAVPCEQSAGSIPECPVQGGISSISIEEMLDRR